MAPLLQLDWDARCKSSNGLDLKHSQMLVTRKPPDASAMWFLESLYHMGVASALPDGCMENFIIKPVRSSINFTIPGGDDATGDATLVLYLANPLGRIAELWFRNVDDPSGYDICIVFNMAQPLPADFDYARFVKGLGTLVSSTIPAGMFQINGRAVCVRFPYPAGEKPGINGSSTAFAKYSYEALVGVQSDPCNIVSGVQMLIPIIVTDFGHFGEKALRLSDNVVTSNANTTVVANDARQALNYVADVVYANNETRTFTDTPTYFRSGQILMTAVAGLTAEVQWYGSFVPNVPGPLAFQIVYFINTYDLMGRTIDTIARPVTVRFDGLIDDKVDFLRSFKFVAPKVGTILSKPSIHRVEVSVEITSLTADVIADNFVLKADAEFHVIAGDARGVGKPSVIWACSGAKGLQFNLEVGQWFEAVPNSRVLQTTTTIPVPHGSLNNMEDFYAGIEYLTARDDWRYVWTGPDWIRANQDFHPAQMLTWKTDLPMIMEQIVEEGGDCSSAKTLFKKLGHELSRDGKKFAKVLNKQGMKLVRQVAPEVLDIAVKRIGSEFGLDDKQIAAVEHLLIKPLKGGKLAGGSLAGGSLATKNKYLTPQQRRLLGQCATKDTVVPDIGQIPDIEECHIPAIKAEGCIYVESDGSLNASEIEKLIARINYREKSVRKAVITSGDSSSEPGSYELNQNFDYGRTIKPRFCGGFCATKKQLNEKPKPSSIENRSYTVSWKDTRGCFVPALFFLTASDHIVTASGLYYLFEDKKIFDEHKKSADGAEWTRDDKGNKLVGHVDHEFEAIIPPYACLMSVTKVEGNSDFDLQVTGDFTRPATGRSVEAAVTALRLWNSHGSRFKLVVAITGDLIKPSDGHGWRFAEMPASFGYYKKQAVKNLLPYRIPVIGNWSGADIVVHNFTDLRKSLDIVTRRGGMCASLNGAVPHCYKHPIEMWKDGNNPYFDLMSWLGEYAKSYASPGSIVRDSEQFGLWVPDEEAEELPKQPMNISQGICMNRNIPDGDQAMGSKRGRGRGRGAKGQTNNSTNRSRPTQQKPAKGNNEEHDPGRLIGHLRKDLESTKKDLVNLAKLVQSVHVHVKNLSKVNAPLKTSDQSENKGNGKNKKRKTDEEVRNIALPKYMAWWETAEALSDTKIDLDGDQVGIVAFMSNWFNKKVTGRPTKDDDEMAKSLKPWLDAVKNQ